MSKTIIERYNIRDSVDLLLDKDKIIVKPLANPREGWEESFRQMSAEKDDELLINELFDDEEFPEW